MKDLRPELDGVAETRGKRLFTKNTAACEVLHPTEALLLPKLRRYFAEFLNHRSPDRLGILYLPTCVGLGYGHRDHSLEAFLGSVGSVTSP